MTDNEIIAAFHAMWDNFPEGVVITQKSREIVAVNKAAAKYGLTAGIKCSSIGKPEDHKGCVAIKRWTAAKRSATPTKDLSARRTVFGYR